VSGKQGTTPSNLTAVGGGIPLGYNELAPTPRGVPVPHTQGTTAASSSSVQM
jgi:hypothetical protein